MAGGGLCATALRADQAARSIWDGVYTAAQAQRGAADYTNHCESCHTDSLAGDGADIPALAGQAFMNNWDGLALSELFDRIHTSMPQNDPGSLSAQEVADLMAYLLSANKIPAGAVELPVDAPSLQTIQFDAKRPKH
jgi:cytochrome c553